MGCITTVGKIILIVLNVVFLLVSLALIVAGVILKYFGGLIAPIILGSLGSSVDKNLHIPKVSDVNEIPFVEDIGLFLLIFGVILFAVSFLACCGACYTFRVLLIIYAIVMIVLVIVQATVGGLFLTEDSSLHHTIKKALGSKVEEEYIFNSSDPFSLTINILNYQLKCCGITGKDDFQANKIPATCCNKTVLSVIPSPGYQNCISGKPDPGNLNTEGCYDELVGKLFEGSTITYAGIALGLLLALQALEAVFAILIVKNGSKVGIV